MAAYTNIDDPSAHFQAETYTGAGVNTSVTFSGNSDLKPDWLWVKRRNAGYAHAAFDSNRSLGSAVDAPFLEPNDVSVENSNQDWWNATNYGINTDGFQFGSVNEHNLNLTDATYVAWAWKANGGTTSTNTDGAISSTVQVNADAGFSILTYTMGTANETVGHGLGVTPDVIIYKARQRGDSNGFWHVYVTEYDGSLDYLKLNTLDAASNSSLSSPTSTTFVGGGSSTVAYRSFVAYCFAEKQGYSAVGTYLGNGNADGPYVYTGFKPKYVLIKPNNANNHWVVMDTARDEYNGGGTAYMFPNASEGEQTAYERMDFLSNGFKLRTNGGEWNGSGRHILYLAFAENPFVTSTGIPTTAR